MKNTNQTTMKKLLISAFLLMTGITAWSKVTLPDILSDNMVLQQQTKARLWGWTDPNKKVTIRTTWDERTYTVEADAQGKWLAAVDTPAASYTPQSILISDDETITLSNILIGEVWFCSGQSNMEMPLAGFDNCPIAGANETIAKAGQWKGIRVAMIEKNGQLEPADRCKGSWKVSSTENAPAFGATAFHFAMMMNQVLNVPIGIINCSWGGSTVEGWLPRKPLQNYTIKGFLWYQGESNVGKHKTYGERLKTMVELWRKEWGLGELPFYFVEIAPFGSAEGTGNALLREAQFKAQALIPNSAMISTNDLVEPYEAYNIHPKDKKHVGERLAYQALSKTYHIGGIEPESPVYKSMEIKDNAAILSFSHADNGFNRMNQMAGFEMAGEDKVFYPAQAEIAGRNQIKVTCEKVARPVAVRYGFRDFLPGNVANLRELPLVPFRTDNWE